MSAAQETDERPVEIADSRASLEPPAAPPASPESSGDATQGLNPAGDSLVEVTHRIAGDNAATASARAAEATGGSKLEAREHCETVSDWAWTAGDRRFLFVVSLVVLLLATIHWARMSGWGRRPIEIHRLPERSFEFRVEINSATWVEWMQLEGIGEVLARRIVEDRETRGPFRSIDDLDRVPGLGAKTIAVIRPWLDCEGCAAEAEPLRDQ
jgi:competence protein ComEA